MARHRIEFICKTNGLLKTIAVIVEADAKPDRLAQLAKKVRVLLEMTLFAEPPLSIESCRDYAENLRGPIP